MDIQTLLNRFSEGEMYKRVATGQNMSLGALINALKALPNQDMLVVGTDGASPDSLNSYRGYYSDLAIQPSRPGRLNTVAKLLAALEGALGETFEGYKGGEFTMERYTPMWWASYGDCGDAIHEVSVQGDVVVITTISTE